MLPEDNDSPAVPSSRCCSVCHHLHTTGPGGGTPHWHLQKVLPPSSLKVFGFESHMTRSCHPFIAVLAINHKSITLHFSMIFSFWAIATFSNISLNSQRYQHLASWLLNSSPIIWVLSHTCGHIPNLSIINILWQSQSPMSLCDLLFLADSLRTQL